MCQYKCIDNDSGFMSGHIYNLEDINNGYYILSGEGNINVYIKEELDKWFEEVEVKIVDINHGEKFNVLHNKLKKQNLELPPCYQDDEREEDYFDIANKYCLKKEYDKAIYYYNKDIKSNFFNYRSLYNIGVCYTRIKKYNEAIKYYKNAIYYYGTNEDNNMDRIYYNMGFCYFKLDNNIKALEYFKKAKEINPNCKDCDKAIKLLESML